MASRRSRWMQVAREGWEDLAARFIAVAEKYPDSDIADGALFHAAYIHHYHIRGESDPWLKLAARPLGPLPRNGGFEAAYAHGNVYGPKPA